jgi:hypothetical protein
MSRERSIAAGMTDYTAYPMKDILRHLTDWLDYTNATVASLKKHRKTAQKMGHLLKNERAVVAYCDCFIELFEGYAYDLERLNNELPNGVRPRHMAILKQLTASLSTQEEYCVEFNSDWIYSPLPHEEMRPLLDSIYQETRDLLRDYRDLANVHYRLETFVDDGS